MPSPIRTSFQVARKPHFCWTCLRSIEAGERYEYSVYADQTEFWTTKAHMRCAAMASLAFDNDETGEGMMDYEIREDSHCSAKHFGWRIYRQMVQKRLARIAPLPLDTTTTETK